MPGSYAQECPHCDHKLKALLTGWYCPNNLCYSNRGRPEFVEAVKKAQEEMAKPRVVVPTPVYGLAAWLPVTKPVRPVTYVHAPSAQAYWDCTCKAPNYTRDFKCWNCLKEYC